MANSAVSPRQHIMRFMGSVQVARAISAVAELGVADALADGPLTPDDLAARTGADAGALHRLLRLLASNGIFAEDEMGRFALTPAADPLRTDIPGSLRDSVRCAWQDLTWAAFGQILHTARTGQSGFEAAFGREFFAHLAAHPELNARFDAAMAVASAPEDSAVAASYPFGELSHVVDVGGGRGGFLTTLLAAHPHLRATLFDQPQVVADAQPLRRAGVKSRCTVEAGDFFTAVPAGADAYILKRILHDWSDDEAVAILTNCARAAGPHGRILAVDAVIKPGNAPDPNKFMDVGMMVLTHGRERTAAEFEDIYRRAGLVLTRIIPTAAPSTLSVVEGVPR